MRNSRPSRFISVLFRPLRRATDAFQARHQALKRENGSLLRFPPAGYDDNCFPDSSESLTYKHRETIHEFRISSGLAEVRWIAGDFIATENETFHGKVTEIREIRYKLL